MGRYSFICLFFCLLLLLEMETRASHIQDKYIIPLPILFPADWFFLFLLHLLPLMYPIVYRPLSPLSILYIPHMIPPRPLTLNIIYILMTSKFRPMEPSLSCIPDLYTQLPTQYFHLCLKGSSNFTCTLNSWTSPVPHICFIHSSPPPLLLGKVNPSIHFLSQGIWSPPDAPIP
jgi:hypothetical protein